MNREEILAIKSGHELDALVAHHIMELQLLGHASVVRNVDCCKGYTIPYAAESDEPAITRPIYVAHCACDMKERQPDDSDYQGHYSACLEVVSDYSADWDAAWQVVEKMREGRWWIDRLTTWVNTGHCTVIFRLDAETIVEATCATAPEAICKAALLAVSNV